MAWRVYITSRKKRFFGKKIFEAKVYMKYPHDANRKIVKKRRFSILSSLSEKKLSYFIKD